MLTRLLARRRTSETSRGRFSARNEHFMLLDPIRLALARRRIARVSARPVVVGATGGSGTRAVHAVLRAAGLYMGAGDRLNHAGDAMDIEPVLDSVINPILIATRGLDYDLTDLPSVLASTARRDLLLAIDRFLRGKPKPQVRWGWKNPRSMFILPLIHALFPDVRFVHVVRDGRDMALSDNQNQPRKHFQAMFGQALDEVDPAGALKLWAEANGTAANWGERVLGANYHRVRFEDLCAEPDREVTRLLDFAGFSGPEAALALKEARHEIAAPTSINRWHQLDPEEANTLSCEGAAALTRFGYPRTIAPQAKPPG